MRFSPRHLLIAFLAAMAIVITSPTGSVAAPVERGPRDVLVVSNNWAGTADLIDPRTLRRLTRINVIPDLGDRLAEIEADPNWLTTFDTIRALVGEGHNQYVDDGFTSRDGRFLYFSRPSLADVVASTCVPGELRGA
jgi:hypothetical protein